MIKRVVITIIAIVIPFLGRGFFFYSGLYSAPPDEIPSYEQVVAQAEPSPYFSDTYEEGEGTILIDLAHDNNFNLEELNVLMLRLVSRGLTVEFFSDGDNLEQELMGDEEEKEDESENDEADEKKDELEEGEEGKAEDDLEKDEADEKKEDLEEELPGADAFIIVCPKREFSKKERETIGDFVDDGGKLLLIADPTRSDKMNSISIRFGLIFEPDYLYNMKENDANYRNIFITDFKEDEITEQLTRIALYTAGSITSAEGGIAFSDANTLSSVIEARTTLSPMAVAGESKVLAIYDLTFMTEPYNGIHDNNQLISNIADWLATAVEEEEEEDEEKEGEEEVTD